jgi:dihydrofolate reductase
MQNVHYYVATSVDGFIARRDGSFDCFLTDGDHVAAFLEDLACYDTVLMGRRTYEIGVRLGVTDPYPALRSIVFSRTMTATLNPRVELARSSASERVRALKASPGRGIYLCGGSELAGALFADGLVDELILKVNPVVLGSGIPLVSMAGGAITLTPLAQRVFGSGVVMLRYRVEPASDQKEPLTTPPPAVG